MANKSADSIITGLVPGLILPMIFLAVIIAVRMNENSFFEYLDSLYRLNVLSKVISICLIPNLLLFFIFIWTNRLRSARGVILSMFIAGLAIGLLKII